MKRQETNIDLYMVKNKVYKDIDLANLLGISQSLLSSNLKKISLKTLINVSTVLNCSVKDLIK